MKWFSNLKIARKLMLSFAFLLTMMVGLGIFAVMQFAKLYAPTHEITDNYLPSITAMGELRVDTVLLRRYELGYIGADTPDVKAAYLNGAEETSTRITDHLSKYETMVDPGEEQELFRKVRSGLQDYQAKRAHASELVRTNLKAATTASYHENKPVFDQVMLDLAAEHKYNVDKAENQRQQSETVFHDSRTLVITVVVLALVLNIFLAVVVSRMIANPLREMKDAAEKLALGDADQPRMVLVRGGSDPRCGTDAQHDRCGYGRQPNRLRTDQGRQSRTGLWRHDAGRPCPIALHGG